MLHLKYIQELRTLDKEIAQFAQQLTSSGSHEKTLFIPTSSTLKNVRANLHALFGDVEEMDESIPIVDVLASHFKDYLSAVQLSLDMMNEDPGRLFLTLGWKLNSVCLGDYRPDHIRYEALMAKAGQAPMLWNDAVLPHTARYDVKKLMKLLKGLTESQKSIAYIVPKLPAAFKSLGEARVGAAKRALEGVLESLQNSIAQVNKLIETKGTPPKPVKRGDDEVIEVTPEEYRNALKNGIGVDLDEILGWHEEENEKTRQEVLAIAAKLTNKVSTTADVSKFLFEKAGPCQTPEEMFARANSYLKLARAAAHKYIWLPEDEVCECAPIPERLKDSYPWGGYSCDYPSRYPLYNTMFLNNFNYRAINDGWIKINAVHEAYPGHHAQFIRAAIDPIPETMKRGASAVAYSEGVCIRTERVFEFVYEDDPYYPLMVALRRHHTSTRIKIDLMLHYFGKTIGDACGMYEKEIGFDRNTARAQVQAHENMMGYFTGYYYGMKKICDLEKQLKWDKKAYTELLFSVGRVNLETFEKIARLTERDRHSLLHDFASKLQFA